jgi:hypothetical protein
VEIRECMYDALANVPTFIVFTIGSASSVTVVDLGMRHVM